MDSAKHLMEMKGAQWLTQQDKIMYELNARIRELNDLLDEEELKRDKLVAGQKGQVEKLQRKVQQQTQKYLAERDVVMQANEKALGQQAVIASLKVRIERAP